MQADMEKFLILDACGSILDTEANGFSYMGSLFGETYLVYHDLSHILVHTCLEIYLW